MSVFVKIIIIVGMEFVFDVLFTGMNPLEGKSFRNPDYRSLLKGILERAFLTFGFISGFPQVLIIFGALKLGTRLKRFEDASTVEARKKESRYNDYYLIGNLLSVALSIVYFIILRS